MSCPKKNQLTSPLTSKLTLKQLRHTAAWGSVAAAMLIGAGQASAQEDNKRAAREREAVRRSQQALRDAQEQQAALQSEKAALLREKQQLDEAAKSAGKQVAASQSQLRGLRGEVDRLKAELKTLEDKAQQERSASAEREAALTQRVDRLQAQLAERTAVATRLSELLAQSTQSLSDAEKKNRDMYALAQQAIDAYRNKGLGETLVHKEPVLGLSAVKLDNRSEALRAQLDAARSGLSASQP